MKKVFTLFFTGIFVSFITCADCFGQINVSCGDTALKETVSQTVKTEEALSHSGNVTVNFKDVDIQTVFQYLSEVSGIDIVSTSEVTGNVTMRLRDKPWEVVLDVITRNFDYAYAREGDIIRVMPKNKLHTEEPVTEVIPLNYVVGGEDSTDIDALLNAVRVIVGEEKVEEGALSKVNFSPSDNSIIVTAIPAKISVIRDMVSKIDKETPQIMLEAKVLEITLDRNDQFGIDWNAVISAAGARMPHTMPFGNTGNARVLQNYMPEAYRNTGKSGLPFIDTTQLINPTTFTTALNTANLFSYGTMDFTNFSATLRLIDEWDNTNILSSPRITTLNNQTAVIKVITSVFLQKQQKTTDTASVVTVEFEEDPREVGVILEVTPHVNEKGEITVDLKPQVSNTLTFTELSVNGTNNAVAMRYNSREADTQVMVRDGETIFIGGLITETTTKEDHKFPILGHLLGWVPWIGSFFKYEQDNIDKTEVVFFVTVHLIKNGKDSVNSSSDISRFYDKLYTKDEKKKDKKHIKNKKECL